jgi:hypothetical protein
MSTTYEITYEEKVEKQQTLHRMSTMPVSTYQEAVKNETYKENGNNAMMRVISDYEKQKITRGKSNMHESPHE